MTRKTTLSFAWALPLLAATAASPLAQTSTSGTGSGAAGGPGTAGGAATSRSQIGAPSPAGVVNPNANGTGLGTSAPGSAETFQNLNQDQNGANPTAGVGQQNVRCPPGSGSVAAASSSVSGDPAGALARATGSRAAGQTPTTDVTGSIEANCTTQP
jgi:hypothetical protein